MNNLISYAFVLFGAMIYTLGHPNVLGVLLPFMPILGTSILIYYVFKAQSIKQAILYFLAFNFIITIFSFYWITDTLREFGGLPWIVAAIMNLGYLFIFSPQYWVLILAIWAIKKYKHSWQFLFFKTGLFSVLLAAFLTGVEYFIPQQFAVMLGQPWIVLTHYLGFAHIFGIPIYSFMSYLLAIEIVRIVKLKRFSYINFVSILLFVGLNPLVAQLKPSYKLKKLRDINVRLVQANISNFLKVAAEGGGYASVAQVLDTYRNLSLEPFIDNERIDLIIWPETAYPYPIYTAKDDLSKTILPNIFAEIIQEQMSELIIGGYDHYKDNPNGSHFKTEYNTAFFIDSMGKLKNTFHKHILIPFGETLPLGPLNETVSKYVPEMAFFAEGTKYPLFHLESGIKLFVNICYELITPEFNREYLNSMKEMPQFLINLTNDSWYGDTVEPEQHLFLARWRSLELDLPMLRSTNTGISTYIDKNGAEVRRLAYNKTGNLDLKIPIEPPHGPTIYQKFGFITILPLWLIYFIFHLLLIKLRYGKSTSN